MTSFLGSAVLFLKTLAVFGGLSLCLGPVPLLVGLGYLGFGLVLGISGLFPKNLSGVLPKHLGQLVVLLDEDLVPLIVLL